MQEHPIPPLYDERSRILILGSFPSVKSREAEFFYAHPQNRFYRVLSSVFKAAFPETTEQRRAFLLRHRIALWDVIKSCEISGSSDASIKHAEANDIRPILERSCIERIYVNGKTAEKLYKKHIEPISCIKAIPLPSTSPANAAWSLERLVEAWRVILSD
ncbi:MAG: DNA-deoxyinosine glycosylase [Clostridia bacterium]|nr:DNA-deoxyinosine glycosylase [Clostridia bacterium]